MRTYAELIDRIANYGDTKVYYVTDVGYVVYRIATGDNLEILFIESAVKDGAVVALRRMIDILKVKPYHSVFAFRLSGNERAAEFYRRLGFRMLRLGQSIYKDDETVLEWMPWDEFVTNIEERLS